MKLLKQMFKTQKLSEDACAGSVSTGDMAGARGVLFTNPVKRKNVAGKKTKVPIIRFKKEANFNLRESFLQYLLAEEDGGFDSVDVISKLTSAEKNQQQDKNTVTYGLEDSDGQIYKVYVRPEQAKDFEAALGSLISSGDDGETTTTETEVAEILFQLKDKFEIVNVEWPTIPEDEEEAVSLDTPQDPNAPQQAPQGNVPPQDGAQPPADGMDPANMDPAGGDMSGDDMSGDMEDTGDTSVTSALNKVIDMLRADADAKKAEARAKEAEARAKEADAAARIADAKVRSEEEVLDMESFYKKKNEEKKEAKKLTNLARYRHETSSDNSSNKDEYGF